uniref:Transposase n=1 Tax=Candidatus Kentrum sp. LFY TaxID=2126342 RepID=A0A450V1L6_9GAMM|nr:MAG: Putative transposase [Candidatus Kentron sp. LFY]
MKRHIHIHFIVSAGGLKLSGKAERFTRYIKRKAKNRRAKKRAKKKKVTVLLDEPSWIHWSFFPHKILRKRYQNLLIECLKERIRKELCSDKPDPDLVVFSEPSAMKGFFDDLKKEYENGFFVHVSEERKDLQMTVGYIGRYARRPPLSEVRIKDYTGQWITFEYKDYRNGGGKVLHTLRTIDFIGRLIRHIPSHYFNVIRHCGILASRVKKQYKEITDRVLESPPEVDEAPNWRERQTAFRGKDPLLCGVCGRVMRFVSSRIPIPLWRVKESLQAAFS